MISRTVRDINHGHYKQCFTKLQRDLMTAHEFKRYCITAGLYKVSKITKGTVIDRQKASELLGVSDSAIDKYLRHGCENKSVIQHLRTIVFGCGQGGVWSGWRMDSKFLYSPYGFRLDPKRIMHLRHMERAADYANNRIVEIETAMAEMHRIGDTTNHKRILDLAMELLEALDHKSKIYTNYLHVTRDNVVNL